MLALGDGRRHTYVAKDSQAKATRLKMQDLAQCSQHKTYQGGSGRRIFLTTFTVELVILSLEYR